jgi:hypothetical protein
MTTYLLTFSFLTAEQVVLDGPDGFDFHEEYRTWKYIIEHRCGPAPSVVIYGSHASWLRKYLALLREYQRAYRTQGDFLALFVEHLIQRRGFRRRVHREVRLG